jgi:universal stress protein A
MSIYRHLLVAVDLTKENDVVLEKAVELARLFGAKISIAHIIEPLPGYGYAYIGVADFESELLQEAKQGMAKLAERFGIEQANCYVEVGPTKSELMGIVLKQHVDCIVAGSHGRHGVAELLGSTAHAIVHGAPCDVITVRIK